MKIKRGDKLFLLFLFLAGIGLGAGIYLPRSGPGSHVEVRINGTAVATYPLSSNLRQTISCPDGSSNTFEIKDGVVFMREADCHDKVCVGMRGISSAGETIVCLPHKLVLAIAGPDGATPGLDAVTGQ